MSISNVIRHFLLFYILKNTKMKNINFSAQILAIFFVAFIVFSCMFSAKNIQHQKQNEKPPTFENGYLLFPDYACQDTLIVMDAESLNNNLITKYKNTSWGSDGDIDSVLHCLNEQGLPACMTFSEYVKFNVGEGYNYNVAYHIAMVDFKRCVKDMDYISVIED